MSRRSRLLFGIAPALALLAASATATPPALAATYTNGQPVSVTGTAFLWVADDQGVLHLVGDTRALTNRFVNWSAPAQIAPSDIGSQTRGDPWLSTGLVKIGDAIYLPKWETNANMPTLYHVQSPADMALIGINNQNYGQIVLDKAAWEQQFGMSSDSLQKAELPAIVPPPPTTTTTSTTPTAPTISAADAAANAARGSLNHVPVFGSGSDVNFDLPGGRGWNDASGIAALKDVIPLGTLGGEQTIAQFRVLNTSGGAYVYVQVKAIDLSGHPDIKTAQDLAALKMRILCRDVSSCEPGNPQDTIFGSVPARVIEAKLTRDLGGQVDISGVTADVDSGTTSDNLTWYTRDVFLVKGNYGYDIRLASTDSGATRGRFSDQDQMLQTLLFHY